MRCVISHCNLGGRADGQDRQAGDAGHGSPRGGADIQEVRQSSGPSGSQLCSLWDLGLWTPGTRCIFFFFIRWILRRKMHYTRGKKCHRLNEFEGFAAVRNVPFFGWAPVGLCAGALRQAGRRRMSLGPGCVYLDGLVPLAGSLHTPQALSACCCERTHSPSPLPYRLLPRRNVKRVTRRVRTRPSFLLQCESNHVWQKGVKGKYWQLPFYFDMR